MRLALAWITHRHNQFPSLMVEFNLYVHIEWFIMTILDVVISVCSIRVTELEFLFFHGTVVVACI